MHVVEPDPGAGPITAVRALKRRAKRMVALLIERQGHPEDDIASGGKIPKLHASEINTNEEGTPSAGRVDGGGPQGAGDRRAPSRGAKRAMATKRQEEHARTVFVGNLPMDINQHKLKKLFSQFGEIASVRIRGLFGPTDSMSKGVIAARRTFDPNQHSCHAFIVLASEKSAREATALNSTLHFDRHITVNTPDSRAAAAGKYVFVGNLPLDTNEEDLWRHFASAFGPVSHVSCVRERATGQCKGCAFVQFASSQALQMCLQSNSHLFSNRYLRVSLASKRNPAKRKGGPLPRAQEVAASNRPRKEERKKKIRKVKKKKESSKRKTQSSLI